MIEINVQPDSHLLLTDFVSMKTVALSAMLNSNITEQNSLAGYFTGDRTSGRSVSSKPRRKRLCCLKLAANLETILKGACIVKYF